MDFIGNLVKKLSERDGDGHRGHWRVAQYLLETVEMYPKRMVVDVFSGEDDGRIEKFDGLIGKNVAVRFDIDSNEYNGRWYNSIRAYSIKENVTEVDNGRKAARRSELGKIETPEGVVMADGTGEAKSPSTVDNSPNEAEGSDNGGDLPF